ncbi:MAG: potassium transporter KefB [Isosphaeraceae bacterium]|jgi:CPA2 family monovalent cation:H+ antiporter-2|nr:MAG: potassium transporter KefB [Isosphaeraceae bacterium]
MPEASIAPIVADLLVVLAAGLISGLVCRRLGVSLLIGYLIAGSIVGPGGLRLVRGDSDDLRHLAEAGALLMLFAVGIEFSPSDLRNLGRAFLVGGPIQMILVALPLILVTRLVGFSWNAAILAGSAGALSSTVLVFRSLLELGRTATPEGRGAIGILIFQDIALVPLLLLLPLLTGEGPPPGPAAYATLALQALAFLILVGVAREAIARGLVPLLAQLRSVELVVLSTLSILGGLATLAVALGLPAAVGALAAGVALSGNRLSKQIDSIVLPFRESFAAVFFVTTGSLLDPSILTREPLLLTLGLAGILILKTAAGTVALRACGLGWAPALAGGLGLAQLGEFALILAAQGVHHGLIDSLNAERMLAIAIGTLILTPQLLRAGLERLPPGSSTPPQPSFDGVARARCALVIGLGPIGRQVASRLEIMGLEVRLLDLSPINLQPFEQSGFHAVAGDARDPAVLRRAGVAEADLIVLSVPDDAIAIQILQTIRELNRNTTILVRCRFQSSTNRLKALGATAVVSEEAEASGRLIALCEQHFAASLANA